jgi:hypothetical protein
MAEPTLTLWKLDGSIQCEGGGASPDDMSGELKSLNFNIQSMRKGVAPGMVFPSVCGAPTGSANFYDVEEAGITRQMLKAAGDAGFRLGGISALSAASAATLDRPVPIPWRPITDKIKDIIKIDPRFARLEIPDEVLDYKSLPMEYVGYAFRQYNEGDPITKDLRLDRYNVVLDPDTKRITRTWVG